MYHDTDQHESLNSATSMLTTDETRFTQETIDTAPAELSTFHTSQKFAAD